MKSSAQPTLRERSKLEKRSRIEAAAREIFAEQGFDKATTREIARRAGVGIATLFVYATDKAQLLRWMFAAELDRISAGGESIATIQFFRPRYEIWLKDPRLSRTVMRIAFAGYLEYASREEECPPPMVWTNLHQGVRELLVRN